MSKCRLLHIVASAVVAAFFVGAQQVQAQENPHHIHVRVVPGTGVHANVANAPKETKKLKKLYATFGVLPPMDASGNDEWPCFGGEPDCSTISLGGVVLGISGYTQSLAGCDNDTATFTPCGQIYSWYQDNTGDNTDHLIASIVVRQGEKYILATGPQDFGVNQTQAGESVIFVEDVAFGTMGNATGPGSGWCGGSTETCVSPIAGVATATITTTVGTSTIHYTFDIFLE